MAVCDGCGVLGWTVPLFTRPIMVAHQPGYLIICGTCKSLADAALVRRIELWEPPFGGSMEEEDEMRGMRAKALRRQIYGEGGNSRQWVWPSSCKPPHRAYQQLKRFLRGMLPEVARRSA